MGSVMMSANFGGRCIQVARRVVRALLVASRVVPPGIESASIIRIVFLISDTCFQQQSQLNFAHEKLFKVSKCNADVDFLKILTVNVGTRQSLKAERY